MSAASPVLFCTPHPHVFVEHTDGLRELVESHVPLHEVDANRAENRVVAGVSLVRVLAVQGHLERASRSCVERLSAVVATSLLCLPTVVDILKGQIKTDPPERGITLGCLEDSFKRVSLVVFHLALLVGPCAT